jgi:hypothetical protein
MPRARAAQSKSSPVINFKVLSKYLKLTFRSAPSAAFKDGTSDSTGPVQNDKVKKLIAEAVESFLKEIQPRDANRRLIVSIV